MKKIITLLFFLSIALQLVAQELEPDYKIVPVRKKVNEIKYNSSYESPLANYVARIYALARQKDWPVPSEMMCLSAGDAHPVASPEFANKLLNTLIEEVIIYKDSVSGVVRREPDNSILVIGWSVMEHGQWKATGEGVYFTGNPADARQEIIRQAKAKLPTLRKYYRQVNVPADTAAFMNYLQQAGTSPKKYLLEKLSHYPLVIYGEIHRRKVSWDLLKETLHDPAFSHVCGTVFMELPTHIQPLFDQFFQLDTLNTDIVLDILSCEQMYGWQDRGMYEFIIEIWKLNRQIQNKIQIIATDSQIPFDSLQTRVDYEFYCEHNMCDRDSTMANAIGNLLKAKTDARNCLFVVGSNHARKSSPDRPVKAGTLLAERLPQTSMFSIMTHSMISDNINCCGQIRYGLYDYLFERNGNKPTAFDLAGSPFGKEPFDALQEVRYNPTSGNYEDFYDGYIFLAPLQDEEYDYTLYELFTDEFVAELKRRATISGSKNAWYGIPTDSVTKEKIIEAIESEKKGQNNKRFYFNF
ncbi:MAG: hypothetical protein LBU42_06335 [Prevotellaceae bacterium]|nr:hypothetical protein [Prevotellaceae bacterium]